MVIKSNFSQERQWYLLEKWYSDLNNMKNFTMFLAVHDYPNNMFEENGLYFAQICKKLHFANRETYPLVWIREKMTESKQYNEVDAEVTYFVDEAYFKHENRLIKTTLDLTIQKVWSQYLIIGYLYILLIISAGLHIFSVKSRDTSWWLI